MSMIRLDNVSKSFGDTHALHNVSMDIERGEFVALLGPSGCGKSTTLMILAGLLRPSSGNVIFNGQVVNDVEPKDRDIGMVFQSYALYPHLKVIDNISFPLKQRGMNKKERYEKARHIAGVLQIESLLDRMPHQLSGGQQQRVAMARALVKDPLFLLLDEPMSNLDARLKIDLRDEIRKTQQRLGITTIIVTHDQEEAMAVADKIAVLDSGKIQQYGTPDELFNSPENLFVAYFMGSPPMNLLDCELSRDGEDTVLKGDGFEWKMQGYSLEDEAYGTPVKLGVRPHQISLQKTLTGNGILATIDLIEQLGREKLVKVMLPRGSQDSPFIRVLTDAHLELRLGETVYLHLDPAHIHLFDATTGKTIAKSRKLLVPQGG